MFDGSQPLTNRKLGQLGNAVDVQLLHDVVAMGADRLHAQVQPIGDLLAARALRSFVKSQEIRNFIDAQW